MTSATAEAGGGLSPADADFVAVARGIATAVAPESSGGMSAYQLEAGRRLAAESRLR